MGSAQSQIRYKIKDKWSTTILYNNTKNTPKAQTKTHDVGQSVCNNDQPSVELIYWRLRVGHQRVNLTKWY